MRVAELGALTGYTTELLARAVGPSAVVFAQNVHTVLERFAARPLLERLARPVNACVLAVDRELDDPLPALASDLDLILGKGRHPQRRLSATAAKDLPGVQKA